MPPVTSTFTRLFRNAAWQGTGEIASRLGAALLAVFLARWLGTEGFGVFGTVFAITGYLGLAVAAGSDVLGMRALAQDRERAAAMTGRVVVTRLLLAAIALAALLLTLAVLPEALTRERSTLLVASLGIVALALNLNWVLRALERGRSIAFASVLEQLVCAGAVIALWQGQMLDVRAAVAAQVLAQWVAVLWCYRAVTAIVGPIEWRAKAAATLTLTRSATTLLMARFPRMLFYSGDTLLAAWLGSTIAAGEYFAAQRIVLALAAFGTLVLASTFPLSCRLAGVDRPGFVVLQWQIIRLLLLALLPVSVLGAGFSAELVAFLFGDSYAASAPVLRVLFIVLPVFIVSVVIQDALFAVYRTRLVLQIGGLAMAVHLLLAVLLAPRLGPLGIAMACLAGEAVGLVALGAASARAFAANGACHAEFRKCVLTLVCGSAMAVALWFSTRFGVVMGGGIAAAIYALMVWRLNVVSSRELALLLDAVRGRAAPEYLSTDDPAIRTP